MHRFSEFFPGLPVLFKGLFVGFNFAFELVEACLAFSTFAFALLFQFHELAHLFNVLVQVLGELVDALFHGLFSVGEGLGEAFHELVLLFPNLSQFDAALADAL